MSKKFVRPADYIVPLNINGLEGRMLRVEGQAKNTKNELLVVYGLDSNLERWWGLVVGLRRYGNVTMVDLPGMGGMDSFYKIGKKPSIDNLADYLAAFVKLKYRRKRLSVIGIGFGFSVVTRMLQRNPDLKNKTNLVISINGYAHKDDFVMSDQRKLQKNIYSRVFSLWAPAQLLSLTTNNRPALKYKHRAGKSDEFMTKFKVDLAKENDLRTRVYITKELLELDNCQKVIDLPFWHITLGPKDPGVNGKLVEQHLRVVYKKYNHQPSRVSQKVAFVFNDEKIAVKLIPAKLRRDLKKTRLV